MKEAIASNTPPPMPSDFPCLPGNRAEEQGARSSRHNHNCHSTISPSSHTRSPGTSFQREFNQAMANFPVDPLPFIPPGIEIDDGRPHRVSRAVVTLSSNVVHTHEEYCLQLILNRCLLPMISTLSCIMYQTTSMKYFIFLSGRSAVTLLVLASIS
jgi:hypothetical protein